MCYAPGMTLIHGTVRLDEHTRLALMAASLAGGAEGYVADSIVLQAIELDNAVARSLRPNPRDTLALYRKGSPE